VNGSVCAIVVTYERRELLVQCLTALGQQSRPPDRVLVVDNASNDGTADLVRERFPQFDLLPLEKNVGGAGGFCAGMERAMELGHDWLWLMDDDTLPEPDALRELLAADRDGERPMILASRVVWSDGRDHPLNKPWPKPVGRDEVIRAATHGLMPLRSASFVSQLVRRDAVERYGLPHAHYFIWNDDVEFSARVLRGETGYWVPRSVARHMTAEFYKPSSAAGERFYYEVRNKLWMIKGPAWEFRNKLLLLRHLEANIRHYLIANRFRPAAIGVVTRGLRDGIRRG
jgi:GT2 family glycosyltransferase